MSAKPGEHRQKVARVEGLAGAGIEGGLADLRRDLVGLGLRPAVFPREGGARRASLTIECDERGDHAREADAAPSRGGGRGGQLGQSRERGRGPVLGPLLGAARARSGGDVPLAFFGYGAALRV